MGKYELRKRTYAVVQVHGMFIAIDKAVEIALKDDRLRLQLEGIYGLRFPTQPITLSDSESRDAVQEVMFS